MFITCFISGSSWTLGSGKVHVDLIGQPGLDKKQAGCKAVVLMGFYVPGAQGPPYTFSFMDPPIGCFQWSSRRIMGPMRCALLCRLLISISKPSGVPRGSPSPHFVPNPSWLPSWDSWALATFYSLYPLLSPSLPGARPKKGLLFLAGGY